MRDYQKHYFYNQKQGNPDNEALAKVNNLQAKIQEAYNNMAASIINGANPNTEIENFSSEMTDLLDSAYLDIWDIEYPDEPDLDTINTQLENTTNNLNEFKAGLLAALAAGDIQSALSSRAGTILLYAGSAWTLYQMAKIKDAPPDSLWQWGGGLDKNSCNTCIDEVNKGPRPLSEITILPAADTECLGNCRHTLERVN